MVSRTLLIICLLTLVACASVPPGSSSAPPLPAPTGSDGATASASDALVEEAVVASRRGDPDGAMALLQRAQRIDSRNPAVYLEMARLYRARGDDQAATAMIEKGLLVCHGSYCRRLRDLRP